MENAWTQFKDWCLGVYEYIVNHVPFEVLVYIAIALVVLILCGMISRILKRRKVEKRLAELEVEVNEIRNNSLQYKFNKAVAFAKTNDDIEEKVDALEPKYNICMQSVSACENLYEKAHDYCTRHKYKKTLRTMDEVETMLSDTDERIRIVDQSLDHILSKETEVREKSDALKERARNLKNGYQKNQAAYMSAQPYIEQQFAEIENTFNTFEEQMFASRFNEAKTEVDLISAKLDDLSDRLEQYPALYEKVSTTLPAALGEIEKSLEQMEEEKIDLTYLNAGDKIDAIQNALRDAVVKLDNGNLSAAVPAIDTVSDQILVFQDDITQEHKAFDEIHHDLESNFAVVDEVELELSEITSLYASIKDRFGLEDWTKRFAAAREQMETLKSERDQIRAQLDNEDVLQVEVVSGYRAFSQRIAAFGTEVKEMKRLLVGASSDESRARKQVTKLQLILNEVSLNTSTRQLPAISAQFNEDLEAGKQKIATVQETLASTPLDVQVLNAQLQDAIDFIYKLYSNANNLVGVAVMVENAIVFGNRFRSSYPALDSDLSKAELCFQNGEYTRALKIAIQAIETLHPGIYEKLVARKDPAVMNQAQ
jgi:septation ring formation regulator